ncbi:RsfA family transcriptional regulator [Paenalkalicoccus suaedae]|uniref:RsfA family transcriptional regulator n=1 Tax=Paenalkalicoccus suaedae TaxID=2592382 RepID=A0A859FCJ5_9BACI|nr:RsfA family transcriptional regulator [Paenalkalicoccus suaedae]QKS70787.1 RsfA family transcriptional regulator [Paenalkalicoccus suaedae]
MMKVRQDAWSHEDDLLLAETVLRHIREGSTQLRAFDEVGDALHRTSAACGFRWNAVVRDKYEDAVKLAKRHRKQVKRQVAKQESPQVFNTQEIMEFTEELAVEPSYLPPKIEVESSQQFVQEEQSKAPSFVTVINYLHELSRYYEGKNERHVSAVTQELEDLKKAHQLLQQKYQSIQEDYQSIIHIMDRARRMALLDEDRDATAFRMDKNGNLEKVAR